MKNFTLFIILTVLILTACGTPTTSTPEPTLSPAPTNTFIPPPTKTLEPTLTPSLTPVPPCDVSTRPLDDSLDYYVNSNFITAVCLPNGNKIVLAYEKKNPTKLSAYIVSPDENLIKWEKPSQIMQKYAFFLFISPDGQKLYWENAIMCGHRQCKSEYYSTSLDDSEQKRIFKNVNSAQNIYISPSGQYISYIDNSFQQLRGCFIYNTTDGISTKLVPDNTNEYGWVRGQNYCFGENHWSPKEDKLYSKLYIKTEAGNSETGYSVLNVPNGEITTFSTNWVSWDDYYKNIGTN